MILNMSNGSIKDKFVDMENVHVVVHEKQPFILDRIIWRIWRFTRTRTSGKFRAFSMSHRNWYWSFLKKFWTWIRLDVHLTHGRDQYCLMIKWSGGQMQKYVFSQIPYCRWEGQSGRIQNVSFPQRIAGNRCRTNWIRVEYFPRIFVIADSTENPRKFCESGTWNLKNSPTGSSSCRCSATSIGQRKETMEFAVRVQKKSRKTRKDSRRDTRRFSVLETKGSGMELFLTHLEENGTLQPLKRWNDSKIQVIQYSRVSVLWVVEFWKRRMAETPCTSLRMLRTPSSGAESFIL